MSDKIELDWQKEIPLRCRHCDGCRDITPLAYNLHHAQRRIEELERENAFLRSEIARAIERGSETMRDVLEGHFAAEKKRMIDIKHDALFLARHMLDTSEGRVNRIESEHQKAIACAERLVTALGTKEEFYNLLAEKAADLLGVQGEPLLSAMNECCKHFDNLAMQPRGKPFERYASGEFVVPKGEGES